MQRVGTLSGRPLPSRTDLPPTADRRSASQSRAVRRVRRLLLPAVALLAFVAAAAGFVVAVNAVGGAPRLLGPYLERRASGHNPLIGTTLNRLLTWVDRGAVQPRPAYPAWAVPPAPVTRSGGTTTAARSVLAADVAQLRAAIADARPGDVITLVPGEYLAEGPSIDIARAGTAEAPITVRAPQPGSVTLHFALLEGFHVRAPHWVFENLTIVGACRNHGDCEHAFHVVGAARNVVIRRNDLRDFNAHIKINGAGGTYPDDGRIEANRLTNSAPRATDAPVTPIDLVAASGWTIDGNFIADFVKDGGDFTSYGAFAKGGGSGNRFLRNIVLCEHRLRGANGRRVGLSFGGGGSDPRGCRDRRCVVEHDDGLMRDNLIASCSDDGIYVNRGARTQLLHNTLIDTAGINVRFAESAARIDGNLLDGPVRAHAGGSVSGGDNLDAWLPALYLGYAGARRHFAAAAELDLRWRGAPPRRAAAADASSPDLCGQSRDARPAYGAFEDFAACLRAATH